jgi:iron complex outermembrane receptor protein
MRRVFEVNARSVFTAVVSVLLCCAGPVRAQSIDAGAAVLSGSVLDPAGNAIPNAGIGVKNEAGTVPRHKAVTAGDGRFSVTDLGAGLYTVDISAAGFTSESRTGVRLTEGGTQDLVVSLKLANMWQAVTVEAESSLAVQASPIRTPLEIHAPVSEISPEFINNFMSPVGDYTDVTQMAPGTFSVSPNGQGLGDSKTYFRGFSDGQYTMTFDGIPFNDTNSPTHHSWAFFPGQWIGGTEFDRSPGTASTIGPTNFGGSIGLESREIPADADIRASVTYGSFNTRLLDLSADSGAFGPGKNRKSSLLMDIHEMKSDGYQTYNHQKRDAGSLKYEYKFSDRTVLTIFGGVIDLFSNTPNTKGPTRAQVAQFGDDYLLSGDPTRPDYFRFNYYHVASDFEYIGLRSDLGNGWNLDNKAYTYRYWNKQNYNGSTITATSATDKLNGYRKIGDTLVLSKVSGRGVFRTGIWYEWAYTDRYQVPYNPITTISALLPNFHEKFDTNSLQPYGEYEFRATRRLVITGGVKLAYYNQKLNQYADNGKTVGCLGGALSGGVCVGGAAFVTHSVGYKNWLPSLDARYRLKDNWSVYTQFATGSVIPPSSVFDVKNAAVKTLPKPTTTKTYQFGSVYKANRFFVNADFYHSHFQNAYTSYTDPVTTEAVFTLPGDSTTTGIEAEGNVILGHGVSAYLNGTLGKAKYVNTGLWVASAPHDTETIGLTWQKNNWDLGFFNKRIGQIYNDNGNTNQAVAINPFNITNVYLNYTVKQHSWLRGSKIRLSVNNLLDKHSIVGINPASTSTSAAAPGDVLTLLAARSISLTITGGYAPRR